MPTTGRDMLYLTASPLAEGNASHTHVKEIVVGLERRGWNVNLVGPEYGHEAESKGWRERMREIFRMQRGVVPEMRRAHIVYFRWHFALWPSARRARRLRKPVVQEVNGIYEDLFIAYPGMKRFRRIATWMMRSQLRTADALIAPTPQLCAFLREEAPGRPVVCVPNGANTDLFRPGAPCSFDLPKPYAVLFGALAPWQGIDMILRALQDPAWPADLHLVIAGDGQCRPEVEAAAKTDARVRYLGRIPYAEVPGVVGGAIASLVTQNNFAGRSKTGFSALKLYESMGCGVPVVATDTPGHREEMIEADCGPIVPVDDAPALAQALRALAENPDEVRRLGVNARRYAEERASWDKRAQDVHEAVLSVLR